MDDDSITVEELDFEIQEAKKAYDNFPYWKKEHFKRMRKVMEAKEKRDMETDPYNNGGSW